MLVGYMRVSTSEQNLALQRDALAGAGCDRFYEGRKAHPCENVR